MSRTRWRLGWALATSQYGKARAWTCTYCDCWACRLADDGIGTADYRWLAKCCGRSVRTIRKRLARLVHEGSLRLVRRGRSHTSAAYEIIDFAAWLRTRNEGGRTKRLRGGAQRGSGGAHKGAHKEAVSLEARASYSLQSSEYKDEEGAIAPIENLSDPKGVPQLVARLNAEEARASGAADRWSVHHADPQRISDGHGGRVYSAVDVRRRLGS